MSVLSFVHAPLHTDWELVQQTPDEQDEPPAHACPQPPQLVLLVLVLTHVPLQQAVPEPHTLPQLPQLLLSLCTAVHAPLHHRSPLAQQWPEAHVWLPLHRDFPEGQTQVLPEQLPLLHG